tara:strand:- start:445 stop:1422 length:978 start_codon:yes stop_codon:yes gene_type:complete
MKIFVTGGSGFIGSSLVKRWLEDGDEIVIFDNEMRGQARRLDSIKNINYIIGDIRDLEHLKKSMIGCDTVCHLAYINGTKFFYEKPDLVLEIALKGIINTTEAAVDLGIKNFWLMSSGEVYQSPSEIPTSESVPLIVPDPKNPRYSYGAGKIISELYALNFGKKYFDQVSIVRPHNVYGPDMGWDHVIPQFITKINKKMKQTTSNEIDIEIYGDGNQTRAFCFIDDFIEGASISFKKGSNCEIYHVGNDFEITVKKLLSEIGKLKKIKISFKSLALPPGETARRCPNISKVKNLGYVPKFNLDQGLRKTIEWYDENMHLINSNKI